MDGSISSKSGWRRSISVTPSSAVFARPTEIDMDSSIWTSVSVPRIRANAGLPDKLGRSFTSTMTIELLPMSPLYGRLLAHTIVQRCFTLFLLFVEWESHSRLFRRFEVGNERETLVPCRSRRRMMLSYSITWSTPEAVMARWPLSKRSIQPFCRRYHI